MSQATRFRFLLTPRTVVSYHQRPRCARLGSIEQVVEQWTFNPLVVGSSPTRPTKASLKVTRPGRLEA